jgi:uncharacterized protein YfaS (alpha-2-macroglobulin family)
MDRWLKDRRVLAIGGAVVAVVLAVVVALYAMGGKHQDGTPTGGFFDRLASGFNSVTSGMTPAEMAEAPEFAFRRLEVDTTKAQAEACLVFTRDLDASGKTHYEDYFSIDPDTKVASHVVGARLCMAGLDFNTTYNVTLKTGLPDAAGDKLTEEETVPVELRDKPALIRFSGGIILPRQNTEGVPVTTVNIKAVDLKIIRVGDRLLSQIESGTVDETTLYSWDATQLQDNQGSVVWSGTMDVANPDNIKNESVVTLVPIDKILKDKKPGAYVLIATDHAKKQVADNDDEYDSDEMAVQWVIDSDMAITTFQGGSGLTAFVRSYANARPMSGVKLTLVARNNNELASVTTGSDGRVDFSANLFNGKGGDEPVVVMAYGSGGDFSFLDLRRPAFDLTDRGVGGRATPGPTDAYLYTERGIYRPGETVKAVAMLRDRIGAALSAPLTLIANRPDGMEVSRITIAGKDLKSGSAAWSLPLNRIAPHGRWQIAAFIDPKGTAVGRVQFDVADFVPQRLKVTLTPVDKVLRANADFHLKAETRFLYGAPGSGLSGEGEARIVADPTPFEQFSDFQFGRMDDKFDDVVVALTVPDSDALGISDISGTIGDLADTTLPLKAMVKVSMHEPGGRTTDKSLEIPVRTQDVLLGLRPDFDYGSVAENARAGFEAIAVNADGKRVALSGVTFSWVKENTTYQWYQEDGSWKYQSVTRDRLITSGTMNLGASGAVKLGQALPWGTYRLTLTDPKSGAAVSYRFYSGWAASSAGDRPDRIPVAANKPAYKPGEVARVDIKPTADGKALVVVAGDKVFFSKLIDAPAKGTSINIPVSADWGAGAYVLVTDYRPLDAATGHEPVRSIGVAWLGVDNSARTLTTLIGGPNKITPRQKLTIPVTIKGLDSGEDAYLTLAAVDEGILQLTDFKSPDPNTYYFGKRRLGVNMRDDYGRLIKPEKAPVGSMREGGDSFGGRPLAVVPTKTVALFSGIVKVGSGGIAQIPLDVPDFNGELRLMVVAWSGNKLGHADRPLTVRDPVVADIVLPRFLAPGDHSQAALNMNNVEGGAGVYVATVTASGPISVTNGQVVLRQSLRVGQRTLVPVPINGSGLGVGSVSLKVTGPRGFSVARSWQMEVRAPQLDIATDDQQVFAGGASYRADGKLIANVVRSTAAVSLNVSSAHGYNDVPGLLRWLDRYPYGCIEQTTSRAMPLLYFNDLADLAHLKKDMSIHDREQDAVDTVLDMQNYAGNFGMWSAGSDADPWISVFALDFLYQAKGKGFVVPNEALRRGTGWLKSAAASDSNNDNVRAYAFYVLARQGQVNLSDLRYFADTRGPEMNTGIAAALTGAAAAQAGDRSRAAFAFGRARDILAAGDPEKYSTDNYGSLVRDLAGTTGLVVEGGQPELVPALLRQADTLNMRLNDTTTQEKAWMLRAAYELTKQRTPLNILVNGQPAQPRAGAVRLSPSVPQLMAGINLLNKGGSVWRTTSVQGTPSVALPPTANGLTLTKTIWTMAGQPADMSSIKQNDRVMVVLSGQMDNNYYRQMGVIDLLPAGLEIETILSGDDNKPYPWLGTLTSTDMTDSRDDRFVASFSIGSQYRNSDAKTPVTPPTYRVAYIARSTVPGTFIMPAGVVEDMYAPSIMARTTVGTMSVK